MSMVRQIPWTKKEQIRMDQMVQELRGLHIVTTAGKKLLIFGVVMTFLVGSNVVKLIPSIHQHGVITATHAYVVMSATN